ncbi:methylase of polypeptide subunit release factors [Chitinophaga skermanii]|uniref:Methylase of polypeptide subunit release factors n=1 Tax=Chitinophaga skermanii TaxID=331697 RepID=A0A327R3A0_9BACT|nr:class I SAM-dependent methyltransferase [Chitinophaga skermanii]RAJ10695.1 methylase of polypeptide subunit release factors [Chitinophaga skermanii]
MENNNNEIVFNPQWYNNLVSRSNEKTLIINAIQKLAAMHKASSCLEIGMGTGKQFSDALAPLFDHYTIIEKYEHALTFHPNVAFIQSDWENVALTQQYDIIIASHVFYYFSDKAAAIHKMLNALTGKGILVLVLNGTGADYGKIKQFFTDLTGYPHTFAHDEFLAIPGIKEQCLTFTLPSVLHFNEPADLYQSLQLSFDHHAEAYAAHQAHITSFIADNFPGQFHIHQKLCLLSNATKPWEYLTQHPDYLVQLGNITLQVNDGVFTPDPQITYSTSWLLENMPPVKGKDILDIGCGPGIIALHCVLQGANKVIATDIDEMAVRNAIHNMRALRAEERMEVLESDLFQAVKGRYHYIFGNLPILDEAWDLGISAQDILSEFLKGCKNYLLPGGQVFFTWASFADMAPVIEVLEELGYGYQIHSTFKHGYDWHFFAVRCA